MALNRDAMLRYIVVIHFICTSMVTMVDWLPFAYYINQVTILFLGLWAITNHDSAIQVEFLMVVKFLSIFIDSIAIGMYFRMARRTFNLIDHSYYFTMSVFFAFVLLLLKPVMLLFLNKVRQDRMGEGSVPSFGGWGANTTPTSVPGYIPVPENSVA